MFSLLCRSVSTPRPLLISVQYAEHSHRPHIDLAGALVGRDATRLNKVVIDVLRSGIPRAIDLNLAGVTDLDATGIEALETCIEDAQQLGCKITLRHLRPIG
jgi:anti-anti-sigma regulatory factor